MKLGLFPWLHDGTLLPRPLNRDDAGWFKSVIGYQGSHVTFSLDH
jgi:hypothetical protein